MPAFKLTILLLVLATLYSTSSGQLSFSTNWGSGKRSGGGNGFRTQAQDLAQVFRPVNEDDIGLCFNQLEYNLLKEVTTLIRREMKEASRCLLGNKENGYE